MIIGHRTEIRSDEGLTLETSAFRISVRWPIYIINSVDNANFLYTTSPPTQHHSFLRNYPFHSSNVKFTSFDVCVLKEGRYDRLTADGGLIFADYVVFQEAPINEVAGLTTMTEWCHGTNCKSVSSSVSYKSSRYKHYLNFRKYFTPILYLF